jgi:dTDP-4-amino-4,6-dideoxygalactose transaminase
MRSKNDVNSLAIFGGPPAFEEKLHVGRPSIPNRERLWAYVNEILDRRWLTNNGRCVQKLERELAETLGVKHCIVTCNGTVALEIAIRALGLTGEVIVPSWTFIATPQALQWLGITPVFCDIDRGSQTIDPQRVEERVTARTTGIIGVHLWGRPCDVEGLADVAQRRGLRLIYDAAHAFGCSHDGRLIGSFGDLEVFSFNATKFFHTLEGGAVVTNNDDIAYTVRSMKYYGFGHDRELIGVGTNGKMHEVSAATGLVLLEDLDELIAVNRRHYMRYNEELRGVPGVHLLTYDDQEQRNYQYVVLEIDHAAAGVSRDCLNNVLRAENILARRYFYPGCHRLEPYRSLFPEAGSWLPETERVAERVLSLPTGTGLGPEDVSGVCHLIRFVIQHNEEIMERLERGSDG